MALAGEQQLAFPWEAGIGAVITRLARTLLDLDREINDIDKTIAERFGDHPYAHIIEALPGFGPGLRAVPRRHTRRYGVLANSRPPGVLHRISACPRGFWASYRQSARPKRYNRRLRRVFCMAAPSSIRGYVTLPDVLASRVERSAGSMLRHM